MLFHWILMTRFHRSQSISHCLIKAQLLMMCMNFGLSTGSGFLPPVAKVAHQFSRSLKPLNLTELNFPL